MKKPLRKLASILILLCLLFTLSAFAEPERVPLTAIGESWKNALPLETGVYYYVDVIGNGWFVLKPEKSGFYCFNAENNNGKTFWFHLYDEWKNELFEFHLGFMGDPKRHTEKYMLEAGKTYYIFIGEGTYWMGMAGQLSVCAPRHTCMAL